MPKHLTESVNGSITATHEFTTGTCRVSTAGAFEVNVIAERVAGSGVTIDSVLLKDDGVAATYMLHPTSGGTLIKVCTDLATDVAAGVTNLAIFETLTTGATVTADASQYFHIYGDGLITVTSGTTFTAYSPEHIIASPKQQVFSGSGNVRFTTAGIDYPNWWGTGNTAVQKAIDAVPVGGVIGLLGKYNTDPITMQVDNNHTGDAGKSIIGMVTAAPRLSTSGVGGAELYMDTSAGDEPVLKIVGATNLAGGPYRASIKLDNFRIHGNRARGGAITNSHGLQAIGIKDLLFGKLTIEECGGDGCNASESGYSTNQMIGEYIEVCKNDGRGFAGGGLADSHINTIISYLNHDTNVSLASTTQVDQLHSYYAGMHLSAGSAGNTGYLAAGLSISGSRCQIGSARVTHNDGNGAQISSGPNYIADLLVKNNGQDVGSTGLTTTSRVGLRFSGTLGGNIIGICSADDTSTTPTQAYGVYYMTNTPNNIVVSYYGDNMIENDVLFSYSTAGGSPYNATVVGNKFPQKVYQTVLFTDLAGTPIVPSEGRIVYVGEVTGSTTVIATINSQSNDGMDLVFMFTNDVVGNTNTITFSSAFIGGAAGVTNAINVTGTTGKSTISFTRRGNYWWETGRQVSM